MQLQMQNMQIGGAYSTMQVPGARSFASAPQQPQQPFVYPQNTFGNPGLLSSTQQGGLATNQTMTDKRGYNWFQGTPIPNDQLSKQNLWK